MDITEERNLELNEIKILKEFCSNRPFKIVELDKNVGVGFVSNELYDSLALNILNDRKIYQELDQNPFNLALEEITSEL